MGLSTLNSNRSNSNIIDQEKITLDLLTMVDENNNVTQRSLALELGVALGLANTYLRRCVDKGLVKIKQVPRNRYSYYLTPRGFSEKARITAEYFKSSFILFRKARREFENILIKCDKHGKKEIVLSDVSDIAEVAILASLGLNPKIKGILGKKGEQYFSGVKILEEDELNKNFDLIIITSLEDSLSRYKILKKMYGKDKVILPNVISKINLGRNNA